MKKLFLILLSLIIFFFSKAQYPINQSIGADSTLVTSKGGLKGRVINFLFADTATANLQRIKQYPAAQIITSGGLMWVRNDNATRWILTGGGSSTIIPNCGILNGTGLVTWDSLLVFDITAATYALCCDNIPRFTSDTTIVLPPSDPDNPRIDAIVLTKNGIKIDTGVAAVNPAIPQLDSCQLLLTYVLINAGQTVPAFVNANNPLIIYDEFTQYEWDSLFHHNVSVDSLNTSFPIHLLNASLVSGYTIGDNYFEFYTDSTINLNDYGALKFYIRENDASTLRLGITWYFNDVPQTFLVEAPIVQHRVGVYQTVVMSTADWQFINSSLVNKIRISVIAGGASGFYLDWMQLQSGIPPPSPVVPGITNVVDNGNIVFTPSVNNNGTTVTIDNPLNNISQGNYLGRNASGIGQPSYVPIDLSVGVTNNLAITNIAPGADGSVLTTSSGVPAWAIFPSDTIRVTNGLTLLPDGNGNDTLILGGTLDRETEIDLSGQFFYISQDEAALLYINPSLNTSSLNAIDGDNNESNMELVASSDNNTYRFTLESNNGVNDVQIEGSANSNEIDYRAATQVFIADSIYLNSTLSGASTGYVWTLKDASSGSGYWAAGGGGGHPTLQEVFNNEVGGSVLTKTDTIQTGTHYLFVNSSTNTSGNGNIYSKNSAAGGVAILAEGAGSSPIAIEAVTDNSSGAGVAFLASAQGSGTQNEGGEFSASGATTNIAGVFLANGAGTNIGLQVSSVGTGVSITSGNGGLGIISNTGNSTTNSILSNSEFTRSTGNTAANGIGESIDFKIETSTGVNQISNQFISQLTDATNATRTSQFSITGVNSGTTGNILVIAGDGSTQMPKYGAGAATFDASGNITSVSDERLKNIQGFYSGGLKELMNVNPISYKWNEKSGMELKHDYIGFSAQNIQSALGENAIGINRDGYLSIQDRAILAALVNAVKEEQKEIEYLKMQINSK